MVGARTDFFLMGSRLRKWLKEGLRNSRNGGKAKAKAKVEES